MLKEIPALNIDFSILVYFFFIILILTCGVVLYKILNEKRY